VTKRFEFDYAHFLPGYEGKCSRLHGHRGVLEVEVSGPPLEAGEVYDSMVVDFGVLKGVVKDKIVDKLDHTLVNELMHVPTAENMARWVWRELRDVFGSNLVKIRVYETPNSWAEFS